MTSFIKRHLGRLVTPLGRKPPTPPRVPDFTRVYCIGDIHGRDDLLERVHNRIAGDVEGFGGRKVVVYIGDYIDRGLQSKEVVDRLIREPLEGFESVFLRGNHEESLLQFLRNIDVGPGWLSFGGQATLYSYGVRVEGIPAGKHQLKELRDRLEDRLPESHMGFYRRLRYSHVEGDYLFVHAGIRPKVPLRRQMEEDLLWIREEFISSTVRHEKMIVHGHSVTPEPDVRPNRIGIDTGAYMSGNLTCLVLEGTERRFL